MDLMSLSRKVALITGASSGIGRATAVLFARLGAKIALIGRDIQQLDVTRQECQKVTQLFGNDPDAFLCVKADLCELEQIDSMYKRVIDHFTCLDILVNNAGVMVRDSIENVDLVAYQNLMNVNVRSVVYLSHLAVQDLIKTKGNIVNVSSVCGTRPGMIITHLHRRGGMSDSEYAQFVERSKQTTVMGRPGEVEEVATAIAYLASCATFTTGDLLHVDGGRSKMCPR